MGESLTVLIIQTQPNATRHGRSPWDDSRHRRSAGEQDHSGGEGRVSFWGIFLGHSLARLWRCSGFVVFSYMATTSSSACRLSWRTHMAGGYMNGKIATVPKAEDLRRASESLHRIIGLTSGLPEDCQADAAFRERLELAAEVLESAAHPHSR